MNKTFFDEEYPYNLFEDMLLYYCKGEYYMPRGPISKAQWEGLQEALLRLPERERVALLMRYRDRESFAAIARTIGNCESYTRQLIHRAIGRLKYPPTALLIIKGTKR